MHCSTNKHLFGGRSTFCFCLRGQYLHLLLLTPPLFAVLHCKKLYAVLHLPWHLYVECINLVRGPQNCRTRRICNFCYYINLTLTSSVKFILSEWRAHRPDMSLFIIQVSHGKGTTYYIHESVLPFFKLHIQMAITI